MTSRKQGQDPARSEVQSVKCARCGRRKAFDDVRCLECQSRGVTDSTRWVPA